VVRKYHSMVAVLGGEEVSMMARNYSVVRVLLDGGEEDDR